MNENLAFVTFFTKEYAANALALIDSIEKTHKSSTIYVMPLDRESRAILVLKSKEMAQIQILDNETVLKELEFYVVNNRSRAEAIFTIKPKIIAEALSRLKTESVLFYCDSDLYFFSQIPEYLFKGANVVISKHLFGKGLRTYYRYGLFNAGFVGFRKNKVGYEVLNWWRSACKDNCSLQLTEDSFADQKYLETFSKLGPGIKEISSFGVNQSLWAIDSHSRLSAKPSLNGELLICFHFHGLRVSRNHVYTDIDRYGVNINRRKTFKTIYLPYIAAIKKNLYLVEEYLEVSKRNELNPLIKYRLVKWC